ncbi:hypothetical protein C7N43_32770 [Sphingobacteriales bacterium UPWRP_1]|nr:hypothetical protein BVG80_01285 [Sphingobacteriales bacterium TSM_CSM]PSJ72722.1 hypothetical protein C7N43_32770 [Sphingobacteriales bacterium UPWRP_1]
MNINRHNYEEYLLDYLEGTLNLELQAEMEAFLANNADVAEEISALAAGMPVLFPDESVVYARKEALKKPEPPKAIAFSNNNNRFFVLSLAAAFILFALGWWAIANFNGLTNTTNSPQLAAQSAQTGKPAANTPQTKPTPTNTGQITYQTANETQTALNTAKVPASGNTKRVQTAVQPSGTATNSRVNSTVAASGLSGNKGYHVYQPEYQTLPASAQTVSIQQPDLQPPLPGNPKTVAHVLPIQPKTAGWVNTQKHTPTALAMQTYSLNNAGLEPATGNQLLVQDNTRQSKALRTIGKLLFDRKKERSQPQDDETHEGLIAQLSNSIVPEAYRNDTEPRLDASISFSLAVSPGTHRILKDLLNR